jgi:hypothetical protein
MTEIIRYCPDCGRDRPYAQHHPAPSCCQDTADGYCVEWYCVTCGAAVILGGVPAHFELPEPVRVRDRVA